MNSHTIPAPVFISPLLIHAVLMIAFAAPAHAQVRPDAGSTQRDLDQRPLEAPRARPPLSTEPARPALKADDTQRFAVASVTISGNTAFDAATLLSLVRDDLVGKSVTLKQLQDAAAKVTAFYRARGYLVARAYIPAQRIAEANAAIEIAVLEGVPGSAAGSSDLTLELGPSALVTGQVEFDNHGNRFTGANRLTGQVNLLSPFGLGESFTARITDSREGLTSATLRGAVPIGVMAGRWVRLTVTRVTSWARILSGSGPRAPRALPARL